MSYNGSELSSGAAKLALALKHLAVKCDSARDSWDDATSRAFHEEHIDPLRPKVKETLEAISRLAEVLARAAREVSDTDDS